MSEHSSIVLIHRWQRRRERLWQSSIIAATYFHNTHTYTHTYTHTPAYTHIHTHTHARIYTHIDTHIYTYTREIKRSGFAVLRQKTLFFPKIVVLRESNTNSDFVFAFDMSYILNMPAMVLVNQTRHAFTVKFGQMTGIDRYYRYIK